LDKLGVPLLKKFFIFLLFVPLLFSSDLKTEQRIYDLIIHALLPQKQEIKVWSDTKEKEELLAPMKNVKIVSTPEKADFLLLSREYTPSVQGIKFVTNIQLLESAQESVVGGFFWQKGRPNILFLRKNLQKHHIKLPKAMQEYVEDEL
jgi:hypothetical protein